MRRVTRVPLGYMWQRDFDHNCLGNDGIQRSNGPEKVCQRNVTWSCHHFKAMWNGWHNWLKKNPLRRLFFCKPWYITPTFRSRTVFLGDYQDGACRVSQDVSERLVQRLFIVCFQTLNLKRLTPLQVYSRLWNCTRRRTSKNGRPGSPWEVKTGICCQVYNRRCSKNRCGRHPKVLAGTAPSLESEKKEEVA